MISNLLPLSPYENAPHYQNGYKFGTTITDGQCGSDGASSGAEWRETFKKGLSFRDVSKKLEAGAPLWSCDGDWVKERFAWAEEYPGVGCPEPEEDC
jgi:hypothetical protein